MTSKARHDLTCVETAVKS